MFTLDFTKHVSRYCKHMKMTKQARHQTLDKFEMMQNIKSSQTTIFFHLNAANTITYHHTHPSSLHICTLKTMQATDSTQNVLHNTVNCWIHLTSLPEIPTQHFAQNKSLLMEKRLPTEFRFITCTHTIGLAEQKHL